MSQTISIHEISSKLVNITSAYKGYKELLHDALVLILEIEDGRWKWESFRGDGPETTREYKYKTFREYLKIWSQFTFEDIERLFLDDVELLPLLRKADVGERGGQEGNQNASKDAVKTKPDNISIRSGEHGTGKAYTLSRLQDQHPEIFERVKAGELSANAAAIQAGFRKPPLTPLEGLHKNWTSASESERMSFLASIGAA
jgi:hypothetical protein